MCGEEAGGIVASRLHPVSAQGGRPLETVVDLDRYACHALEIEADGLRVDDKKGGVGRGGLKRTARAEEKRTNIQRAFAEGRDILPVGGGDVDYRVDEQLFGRDGEHETRCAFGHPSRVGVGSENADLAIDASPRLAFNPSKIACP